MLDHGESNPLAARVASTSASYRPAPGRLTLAACAALIAGNAMGSVGGTVMPLLLSGFSERFKLSDTFSGVVAAAQLLAIAVVSLLLARRAMRPGRARIARWGLLVAGVGLVLCTWAPQAWVLLPTNVLAGAGLGAVFAASTAGLAAIEDVDRASAVTVFGSTVVIAVLVILIPWASSAHGGTAGFLVVALCTVPAWWLVRGLPEGREPELGATSDPPTWWFLGAVALLAATDQGAWSYAAVLGEHHAGMSSGAVALVLALASIAALVGVSASAFAARRLGRIKTLLIVLATEAGAKFLVAACPWAPVYVLATILWQVGYLALLVQMLAVVTTRDPTGRWAASAGGALAVGTGLGSAAAGWLLDELGAPTFGAILAVFTALAAIPLLQVARSLPRRTLETRMASPTPNAIGG